MENHYQIPIYYTYKEFESNYNSDFKQWLDVYPDGRELDFIKELEKIYSSFFSGIHNERISFMYYITIHCYNNDKYLYSKELQMDEFVSVINLRIKDFIKTQRKSILKSITEFSQVESIIINNILGKKQIDEYDIEVYYFTKYKAFIELSENTFDLIFNYVKFRNFEFSINRIIYWIEKQNTTLGSIDSNKIEKQVSNSNNSLPKLIWKSSKTDLTELVKALIENGSLGTVTNQKDIYDSFCDFLGVEKFNYFDTLTSVKNRSNPVKFIHSLETSFNIYVKKGEE